VSTDQVALELFFQGLSTSLLADREPRTYPGRALDLSSPELKRRLILFETNVGRVPKRLHQRLSVALNRDQISSKLWLIEHLAASTSLLESRLLVIGGWYGIFPLLLQCLYTSHEIRMDLIDCDQLACEVAASLLQGIVEGITVTCKNACEVDYEEFRRERHTIVVNTICEHMSDFSDWLQLVPKGQGVALQSNNHWGCSEHVNCVASLEAFESQVSLSQLYFRGTLPLENFMRFMLIGRR
jgi:hypothetical protein